MVNTTSLTLGEHTIKIEVSTTKNSSSKDYNIVLDSFEILNNTIIQPGKYEQTNSKITYIGSWSTQNHSGYSGGSAMLSKTHGDYLTFKFYGTGIKVNSIASSICGISNIYIDGRKVTWDNYNSSMKFNSLMVNTTSLTLGEHIIKIEVSNTKNNNSKDYNVALDSFEILE